jgi:hypothetical protein
MDLIKPVIVIPAYNRAQSLARLLKSVDDADYPEVVKLFISLEGEASADVQRVAFEFSSPKMHIEVIERPERLGLRSHILACGDLALEFGAVIVLEDDLLVDRYFYHYAVAALRHYSDEASIAGLALYAPEYNEYAGLPFKPMGNGYSTYPMQVPCSWGQCWSASQWSRFRNWYANATSATVLDTVALPGAVKSWPESSWKKYFAAYLVQTNRYFIYPYQAYTTNCSDPGGTHIIHGSDIHQVSFASQLRPLSETFVCPLADPDVSYDAFMEPCGSAVYRQLGLNRNEVEIDSLGIKPIALLNKKTYALTCRPASNHIRQYPRSFRPIENNFSHPIKSAEQNVLSLVKSLHVVRRDAYRRSIEEYSYYAGINIGSLRLAWEIVQALPKLIYMRVAGRKK